MSAQTEKKPERKSKPPSERKSVPPERRSSKPPRIIGGSSTQMLHKKFADMGNMGCLIEGAITEKVGEEVGDVKVKLNEIGERIDRHETAYNAALGEAARREEAAEEALGEIETNTKTLEAVKDEFAEMKKGIAEHKKTVEEHTGKVGVLESSVEDLKTVMEAREKGMEFRARELEHDFKESVGRIREAAESRVKSVEARLAEVLEKFELMEKEQKGIHKRIDTVEDDSRTTRKIADEAAHDSEVAKAAASGALEVAASIQNATNGISSDMHRMGKEVERLSITPPPSATAEEAVGETSGVARIPPPPVRMGESKKEIEEMLDEIELELDQRRATVLELKEVANILLDVYSVDGIKEAEKAVPVDFTECGGYGKLRDISKKRLDTLAGQITRMREQGAELKAIYEAAGRLARKTGLEVQKLPPREAEELAIERATEFSSITVRGDIERAAGELSRELDKQAHKIEMVHDILNKVANVDQEGELE